jgi:HSP20 family protein
VIPPAVPTLRDEMNRLFDDFFGFAPMPGLPLTRWVAFAPSVDVAETANALVVKAELPGMSPEDVDINLTGNVLTLKGEKKEEREDKEANWYRVERSYGQFQRAFVLPESIDPEKVTANFDKGVLTIEIAKTEAAKPRQIRVNVKK